MTGVAIIADSKGKGFGFAKGVWEYVKGKEKRDFPIHLIDIERTDFPDGEFKIRVKDNVRRKMCFFIHDGNKKPSDWFSELAFSLDAMRFSSPSEINVVMPYVRFSRQDRKDESRVGVSAKVVAEVVSKHADRAMTVDLHVAQMQEYFDIPLDNLYSFTVLIEHLQGKHKSLLENLVLVSPDAGGGKRIESLQKRLMKKGFRADVAYGNKKRGEDGEVEYIEIAGNVGGKNCLIIDDIISSGGTLIETAGALRERKAKRVYAYGTHGLFTAGYGGFDALDEAMTSDTLYNNGRDRKIEVVSLINLFGEAIYRTIVGESLSDLFDK